MTEPHPPRITDPVLAACDGVSHAFFTRAGGVSNGVYASLNVGYGSGDARDNVGENRRRAMACLDCPPTALTTLYQTHSADAVVVDRIWEPSDAPRADGMVTDRPGIVLGILTADCAPVLLAGTTPDGGPVIGAAHAGWRGALAGVLDATVAVMERLGANPERIRAAVGPCIGARSYEVGPEFAPPFLDQDPENARFFSAGKRAGHPYFDLAGYVAHRLARCGIREVGRIEADTCADEARFFSYRRTTLANEADYGRELSAVVIDA